MAEEPSIKGQTYFMAFALSAMAVAGGCESDAAPRASSASPPVAESQVARSRAERPDDDEKEPPELGAASGWIRNFEEGLAASKESGKPIFLLFTEVPGCHTVNEFADGPLSQSLIVDAIETEFVPVAIYNNWDGHDRKVTDAFGEPHFNNPIVRFIDAEKNELAGRYGKPRTIGHLADSMAKALTKADRDVPRYLQLLAHETTANREKAHFSMYCFWSGEVKLSGLDGVISTRPGHLGGREVVEVVYDTEQTSLSALAEAAKKHDAASGFVARSEADADAVRPHLSDVVVTEESMHFARKDDKKQMRKTAWFDVDMTPAQASRVNRALVTEGESPRDYLSPRQIAEANGR